MNERLTIQDLIDLLAAKHSMTKKDAEAFVKEFFLLIEQALENEKAVKIKGLGTFKLIDVDRRESVKVTTGERFQIKGHTKVSFSPDTNLRDTINKPFAHFETVLLNENTILEDTPVEEMEEDFAEETDTIHEEQTTENSVVAEEIVNEELTAVENPVMEKVVEQPEAEEVSIPTEQVIEQKSVEENLNPVQVTSTTSKEENVPVKEVKEKSPVSYLITVIIFVLLLCGGVILYIYYPDLFSSLSSSDKNALDIPDVTTQPVQPKVQLSDTIEHKDTIREIVPDTVKTIIVPQTATEKKVVAPIKTEDKVGQQKLSVPVYVDSVSYKIIGTKAKHNIQMVVQATLMVQHRP